MSAAAGAAALADAPRRRGRPPSGARDRILAAAIDVLKRDGYAGLTVAKVADRAGESKALIAYHFQSKAGLVEAAGREVAEAITTTVVDTIEGATTVEEVIRRAMTAVDRILEEDARVGRLYFDLASVSVVDPEVRRTIMAIGAGWREVLSDLLVGADDGPSPARAKVLSVMMIAMLQGFSLERIERGPSPELKRAQELFVRSAVAAY